MNSSIKSWKSIKIMKHIVNKCKKTFDLSKLNIREVNYLFG